MSLNEKSITKFTWRLFWRTLRRINYFPLFIAFLIIIFCFLFISLIQNELFLLYNDKGITLSIFTSILSGAIIFSLIEIFTKITTTIEKSSHELFYKEIFLDEGLEYIYSKRGINDVYTKKIHQAKSRIWAFGMTNGNLLKSQLDYILLNLAKNSKMDVVISFWSSDSEFILKKDDGTKDSISIINQQLIIEDGKKIEVETIQKTYKEIIKKYEETLSHQKGNMRIVEMTLPSNFTCFIIDEDVFFFPFLSNVESTSSPTILCNINRGMGLNIFTHFKVVLSNENVTKSIYSSYE